MKIDQSFVKDIQDDTDDGTIASSIISLAHILKLKVIAEGVETEAQRNYLLRHDCDEMQGYLFSRPIAAQDMEQMLRTNGSRHLI